MLLIIKHHSYLPKEVGNTQSEIPIPIHVNGNFPNVLFGISFLCEKQQRQMQPGQKKFQLSRTNSSELTQILGTQ